MAYPRQDEAVRLRTLEKGQNPFAAILSCSDSRIPIEMVFDKGIGDIFSVQNAGNVCDETAIGSFELGITQFDIPLLIVMGHTDCGAVKIAVKGTLMDGNIPQVINRIRPAVETVLKRKPKIEGDALVLESARENAQRTAAEFVDNSKIIRDRVEGGSLTVKSAFYYLENGMVEWLD